MSSKRPLLIPDKVAVSCKTLSEVKAVFKEMSLVKPTIVDNYTRDGIAYTYEYILQNCNVAVGIKTEEFFFGRFTSLRLETEEYFIRNGFEIIDYSELKPVIDLGRVQKSESSVEFLLGI